MVRNCSQSRRKLIAGAVLALASMGMALPAGAVTENSLKDGVAVQGYDVVTYFKASKPTRGDAQYSAQYDGATYHFATAANRDAFKASPAKFAPAYGGYCAFGTAMGRKFPGDPMVWKVRDGKLYLNLNKNIQAKWNENIPGFIRGADNNWPRIRSVADADLKQGPPDGVTIGAQ
ncbi:MAG: YHS domain-containing (seleno)protein [Pseudomonadota bacterium]